MNFLILIRNQILVCIDFIFFVRPSEIPFQCSMLMLLLFATIHKDTIKLVTIREVSAAVWRNNGTFFFFFTSCTAEAKQKFNISDVKHVTHGPCAFSREFRFSISSQLTVGYIVLWIFRPSNLKSKYFFCHLSA